MTNIEWTEKTWNPIVGCSVTSAGCTHCYAMAMAGRIQAMQPGGHYEGTTQKVNGKTVWTGKVAEAPDHIWEQPLRRKKPTTYFVNSMGDLFHPNVPDAWIDRAFAVMALAPQHTFQVLTKHPERMRDWMLEHATEAWGDLSYATFFQQAFDWPYFADKQEWLDNHLNNGALDDALCCQPELWPNVHLGVSVENNEHRHRITVLQQTPAAIRFISYEPAIGPLDLVHIGDSFKPEPNVTVRLQHGAFSHITNGTYNLRPIDWVICGGESGKGARPMHPDWARSLRDQCGAAGVPFFFKQWGAWCEAREGQEDHHSKWRAMYLDGRLTSPAKAATETTENLAVIARVGKKAAGRLLDGRFHDGLPEIRRAA